MSARDVLMLDDAARADVWRATIDVVERYLTGLPEREIARAMSADEVRAYAGLVDFRRPLDPAGAVRYVVEGFERFHVHNAHPRYFGLFVPASSTMGIVGDTLAAAFNPVLAAWRLSPFAVELELHLVRALAARFGFDPRAAEGSFTSGGSEANHTALAAALFRRFPEAGVGGLRAADAEPVLYVSIEAHHSFLKAAKLCGLGTASVRSVAVDSALALDSADLRRQVRADRAAGKAPFFVVATAGTTNAGVVDPIRALADVAFEEGLWLHVDGAWGGAGAFLPELRGTFDGIERADSITFDPHKWLSVPMSAGLFVTRHAGLLAATFSLDEPYMPRSEEHGGPVDFYRRSMQWARRFIGLKLFLTLAVAGWDGYERVLREQVALGERLRTRLTAAGFLLANHTPLPVVCFTLPGDCRSIETALQDIAARVVASGRAWISTTRIGPARQLVLRAAVTSLHTTDDDVDAAVDALVGARADTAALAPRDTHARRDVTTRRTD
jgi:glutamate/tyrosine decarboxylase-like PLP-dependent enzyme